MLLRVYSQNIDGLEEIAGVSSKKMVYAHGSLNYATCCTCKRKVSAKDIEPAILQRTIPLCQQPTKGSNNKRNKSISSNNSTSSTSSSNDSLRNGRASRSSLQPPTQEQQPTSSSLPDRDRTRKRPRVDHGSEIAEEEASNICGGTLKPGVVFFGEKLQDTVGKSLESDRKKVDALIVIGTSLSVYVQ